MTGPISGEAYTMGALFQLRVGLLSDHEAIQDYGLGP